MSYTTLHKSDSGSLDLFQDEAGLDLDFELPFALGEIHLVTDLSVEEMTLIALRIIKSIAERVGDDQREYLAKVSAHVLHNQHGLMGEFTWEETDEARDATKE